MFTRVAGEPYREGKRFTNIAERSYKQAEVFTNKADKPYKQADKTERVGKKVYREGDEVNKEYLRKWCMNLGQMDVYECKREEITIFTWSFLHV